MEMSILIGGLLILISIIGISSRFIFKKTDNKVEEMSEHILKMKTGIDIDLSPDTPDPDQDYPDNDSAPPANKINTNK